MYTKQEIADSYREMTDGSTRPALASTKPSPEGFNRFWKNTFKTIDEMFPIEEGL